MDLYSPQATFEAFAPEVDGHDPRRTPVLVVEDDEAMRLLYTRYLQGSDFEPLFADSLHDARRALARVRPGIIILDVVLHGEQVWRWLAELKGAEATRAIPVLIVSTISDERKGLALGADEYCVKPIEREPLLAQLIRPRDGRPKQLDVLVIEDDESARYLLKKYLSGGSYEVREAITLSDGTEQIRARHPDVIFLDLNLPDGNGADLLARLRANAATRAIPVVIFTSQTLSDSVRDELELLSNAILYKDGMSRDSVLQVLPAPG